MCNKIETKDSLEVPSPTIFCVLGVLLGYGLRNQLAASE